MKPKTDQHRGAEIQIRAEYAKMISAFVSTDKESRYYLTGFYCQRHPSGGALIVATDGSSLGVFWDEFGEVGVPGIIALRATTLAACAADRTLIVEADRASVYELWNKDNRAGLLVAAQDAAVIDGTFPEWRQVIPNLPRKVEVATFNQRLVQKFRGIRPAGAKFGALRVYASSASDAALVLTDREDFLGVIMPYAAAIPDHLPRWLPAFAGKSAWPSAAASGPAEPLDPGAPGAGDGAGAPGEGEDGPAEATVPAGVVDLGARRRRGRPRAPFPAPGATEGDPDATPAAAAAPREPGEPELPIGDEAREPEAPIGEPTEAELEQSRRDQTAEFLGRSPAPEPEHPTL